MSDRFLRKDIWSIVAVITGLAALSIAVIVILTDRAILKQEQDILGQKMVTASALASRFELRIQGSTDILRFAANSGEFSEINNAEMVNSEFKGIPLGLEEEKRKILRDTHANYGIFDTIHFMLPNGDIYMLEPYDRQLMLPRLNFADREYFQGATGTGRPYISNTIISTASNHRVLPIAVPAYDADERLTGLIVGATDLDLLEDQLRKELHLANNHRIIYVDENSNVIEDLSEAASDSFTNLVPVGHLQSVQLVLEGKSGHIVEFVDDVEVLTVYRPAAVHDHQWGVMVMQPTADAFSAIDYQRNQSYVMMIIIVSIIGASGYFLVSFRIHSSLAKELAEANSELIKKDKLNDEFLKIASHELRTPIQPILGYSSLAVRGIVQQDTAWQVVHKEAQKLMKLSNNIVDISMIQAGILGYQIDKVNIAELLMAAID